MCENDLLRAIWSENRLLMVAVPLCSFSLAPYALFSFITLTHTHLQTLQPVPQQTFPVYPQHFQPQLLQDSLADNLLPPQLWNHLT